MEASSAVTPSECSTSRLGIVAWVNKSLSLSLARRVEVYEFVWFKEFDII